jgi:hypothetical protein
MALGVCLVAVAVRRYLRATATRPRPAAPVPERASVTANGANGGPGASWDPRATRPN